MSNFKNKFFVFILCNFFTLYGDEVDSFYLFKTACLDLRYHVTQQSLLKARKSLNDFIAYLDPKEIRRKRLKERVNILERVHVKWATSRGLEPPLLSFIIPVYNRASVVSQ